MASKKTRSTAGKPIKLAFDSTAFKTYAKWAPGVAAIFFPVYHLCNWFTASRQTVYQFYWHAELQIPFIKEFFWFYISVYLLILLPPFFLNSAQLAKLGKQLILSILIAAVFFLLFPSELGFPRLVPEDALYASLYSAMFAVDLPHNMVPSLHITLSALLLLAFRDAARSTTYSIIWASWFTLIALSTLFVHQHHLTDILTGVLLAMIVRQITQVGKNG